MRAKNPFTTITSSGMLLPIDLLVRIADGDAKLPGLTSDAYHLRSGERLNEAASRAWTQCKAAWDSFRRKLAVLPASDTATTLTRNEWLLPLFQELDYGRLQPKPAIFIDEKTYPVSHRWEEHVPIHLLSAKIPLDKRTAGVDGAATRSPYSMVQELLNRSGKFRWGMVSNGLKLYLLRDNNSLSRAANVEFDLEAMMDGEVYADFMLLWLLCHQSRVEILSTGAGSQTTRENSESQGAGKKGKAKGKASGKTAKLASRKTGKLLIEDDDPESTDIDSESDLDELDESDAVELPETASRPDPSSCWLERWTKEAESRGTRAREKLRSGVENAINALGAGFLETRGNEQLKQRLTTGTLDKQDFYRQLLRMVYRLLLLLVAEEKKDENGQNLLHPLGTPDAVRQRYAKFYSVGRLRDLAGLRRGTSHTDLFESLKVLFEKLREGYEPLGIPGLGSFLFSTTATPDLDNAHLSNVAILECFRHLSYTDDVSKSRRVVDFGNLGSEELGSVYESLLELHPRINSDKGPFVLDSAAGSERKTTGSYYTPTSLINCLLDSALDPVVNDAINVSDPNEAERRLLNLKVCDPACGSGHFLIAAAERLAVHLARLRTGDDQPLTMVVQHAKRDIIGRCIYGVDLNPMAVELCKVSLWMEALDPGRPLSFLDHHIQCGNSLLGTTPSLLENGIPDEAFNPIEGDVKSVCADLKKRNKRERADRESGQGYLFESYIKLGNLPSEFVRLSSDSDDTVSAVDAKAKRYAELVSGADYLNARLLADAWCAVFVWKKDGSDLGKLCPTERDFRMIEVNPHSILPHVKSEVRRLADQYQLLHWHLTFPDVFRLPDEGSRPLNEQTGWNAGFDAVIGNPPWERINLEEKEWFATRQLTIAEATTGALRKRMIEKLRDTDPVLYVQYSEASRHHAALAILLSSTGRFPLCAKGRINTFAVFAELNLHLISVYGRVGCIVPTGIATDDNSKNFFQEITTNGCLVSLYDFENRDGIFPGVHRSYKFCLLTLSGRGKRTDLTTFAFFAHGVSDLANEDRVFTLAPEDIALLNPNTRTCPIFRIRRDADLTLAIYRRFPVLVRKLSSGAVSPWSMQCRQGLFNMTSDSQHFREPTSLTDEGFHLFGNRYIRDSDEYLPLYEAKMIHQFNHRHASIGGTAGTVAGNQGVVFDDSMLSSPTTFAMPRYWVDARLVDKELPGMEWAVGFRDITRATDFRTWTVSILPKSAVGNNLPLILFRNDAVTARHIGCFVTAANAFATDFFVRQKIGGIHLNFYIVEQFAVPPPSFFDTKVLPSGESFKDWLTPRFLELLYTSEDVTPFARACGYKGPPNVWNAERRMQIRAEIDAAYFLLYGLNRDDADYILSTFPIVRHRDERQFGDFRTKLLILDCYDRMIDSGWKRSASESLTT